MPVIQAHGGYCCGIRHLHNFPVPPNASSLQSYRSAMGMDRRGGETILVEAVLLRSQVENWGAFLLQEGFVPTMTFVNGNSGNQLWVFHKHKDLDPKAYSVKLPYMAPVPSFPDVLGAGTPVNTKVEVTNRRSKYFGRTGLIRGRSSRWDRNLTFRVLFGDPFEGETTVDIAASSLKIYEEKRK